MSAADRAGASPPPAPSWSLRWRRTEPLRRRVALGALAGTAGGLLVALFDALWASAGSPHGLSAVFAPAAGLVLPVTLLFGLGVGFASWLAHPRIEPSLPRLFDWLRGSAAGRPADVAAFVPLLAWGAFVWVVLSAQLARLLLNAEAAPRLCGLAIALGSLGIACGLAFAVLALTPVLRRRLATWSEHSKRFVDPAATLGISLLLPAALVGYGVISGTVSGEGGWLGIFGILKRQELDLRAPGALLGLALMIYLAPPLLRWLRPYQALVAALVLPCGLTFYTAYGLNDHGDIAQLIERSAPLGQRSLKLARRLTDGDGDGTSALFGGGDCNDSDAAIGPGADEVPDNGVDEDCSGSDLSLRAIAKARPKPPPPPKGADDKLPKSGNVILITIDTLRYDVGYMGYKRPISPHIDALAKRSTVFERTYALASYTGKSVGPMLIGKYGSETHRNWGHFNKFGPEDRFVAERVKAAGIHTLSVQGHHYFGDWGGIERGFEQLDLSAAPPKSAKWAHDTTVTSDKLTDAGLGLLKKLPPDKRFFLWINYLDPHADYTRHEEFDYGNDARDLYDSEVAYTDKHVGRLLDYIDKAPWADRTTIILTSDHGEAFGEHKMFRHGFELWEVLVRVPLIIHVPGFEPTRIKARRSLIDLVPTILHLLRIPQPSGDPKSDDFLSGVSLLPDLLLEPGQKPAERDILIDMPAGPYNEARRAFIHGDLKLIISRDVHKELFDLAQDPDESKDIYQTHRQQIDDRYAAFKAGLREIKVTGERKQ